MIRCHCPVLWVSLWWRRWHFMKSTFHVRVNSGKRKRLRLEKSALSNLTSITRDLLSLGSSCLPLSAWLIWQGEWSVLFFKVLLKTTYSGFTQYKHCFAHIKQFNLTSVTFMHKWAPLLLKFALNVAKGKCLSEKHPSLITSLSRQESHKTFQ